MKSLATLLIIVAAETWQPPNGLFFGEPAVSWEYEGYRHEIDRYKKELKFAEEFNRTNTAPNQVAMVNGLNFDWRPKSGQKEIGYRSDGIVVWRELPEGKK